MEENVENKIDHDDVDKIGDDEVLSEDRERHFDKLKNEEEVKETKSGFGWKGIAIIVLAVLVLIFLFIKSGNGVASITGAFSQEGAKVDGLNVEFYVMSQCPYGTQVEDAVKPVLDELGKNINFKIDFIGMENSGQFSSLHGEPEVLGDKVQLCAMKYEPEKYMDMIVCMNKDARSIPGNWEGCASGLNVAKIKACYEGDEANQLLRESFVRSTAKQATGSPTIYVSGKQYSGGRDALSFKREFCKYLDITECKEIAECSVASDCAPSSDKDAKCVEGKCQYQDSLKFDMYIVNSKECSDCDTTQIVGAIKNMFKGANIIQLDVTSEEGKKFVDDLGLVYVPAYILDKKIEETYTWTSTPQLQTAFEKNGDYYQILD